MRVRFRGADLRREFASDRSAPALHACLVAAVQEGVYLEAPIAALRSLEATNGPSPCTDEFLLQSGPDSTGRGARAMRDSPVLLDSWTAVAGSLGATGLWTQADRIFRSGEANVDDPVARVTLAVGRITHHAQRFDTAGVMALSQSLASALRRDGRPGPLAEYLSQLCTNLQRWPGSTAEARSTACGQFNALVHTHHAWFSEWLMTHSRGKIMLESGELTAARPILTRSIELADSAGSPALRVISYTERGRAYSKGGQLARALRDLEHAVALAPAAGEPYYMAEAYHNLAHTYEGSARFAEAAVAADSFVAVADQMPASVQRMMSRHDAGMIRWEAGWHAAAIRDFDAMVRVIDEQHDGAFYAGEYFERTGDLGRALTYYRDGSRKQNHESHTLAALARIYDALGMDDSAEAVAREHDGEKQVWQILDRPLLPDLLAKRGRTGEAVALADAWARHELTAGNVQGAALAQLRFAELLLLARDPERALIAARSADSLSRSLRLVGEAIEARTLEGRALFDAGMRVPALSALRSAVRLANANRSTDALLSTNLALGRALEISGQSTEALDAYDRAGAAVEKMTASLNEDVDRSGYKSLHLAPFDGALRILFHREPSAAGVGAALSWSVRRKAAAFALSGAPGRTHRQRESVTTMRNQLRAGDALIDFTVLDSLVAAIVLRRGTATLIPLHVSAGQLTTWVDALRRPLMATMGGRVDLAHAPFDRVAAERLFRALIAPLVKSLAGATRLAIVPDGAIWYVPFSALIARTPSDSADGRGRAHYMIEQYEVRLLPSASFLAGGDGGVLPSDFHVDALTYDVPGGGAELQAIRRALGATRVRTREDSGATEHAVLNATAEVLHLAAHGLVDDRDPLASHLRLAPGGEDDGLLHSSEIAAHRLKPRLVVLTACEGVNGKLYAGEGLVGLARAFLLSGAHQVIASEWPVDSTAADLTGVFYRELGRGMTPSAALRAAQRALLARPATSHPIHWAGFVLFEGR